MNAGSAGGASVAGNGGGGAFSSAITGTSYVYGTGGSATTTTAKNYGDGGDYNGGLGGAGVVILKMPFSSSE